MLQCDVLTVLHESRVKDHRRMKIGHKMRYWCSQDEDWKKKEKKSTKTDARHRDNVGMKRYPRRSRLRITCCETAGSKIIVTIRMEHHAGNYLIRFTYVLSISHRQTVQIRIFGDVEKKGTLILCWAHYVTTAKRITSSKLVY
jgi:hypothetical protein